MAKPPRQPVTAATIAAAIASAPAVGSDEAASTSAAPAPDAPVQSEQAQDDIAEVAADEADDEPVEARVLIAFDDHAPNDIFVGSRDDIGDLEREQKVDADPKAVAYAKSLIEG